MSKFTKGPWVAAYQDDGTTAILSDKGDIITYAWDMSDDVDCLENARLIAKAPELYEMVLSLADELNYMINKENERLKKNIRCDDLNPPDYLDQESVYLAHKLLKEIDGE